MAQHLAQDALRAVFQHLNCVELARCVCVCRNWNLAAHCGQLWRQQLQAEFGLNKCMAQAEDPYQLFQACLRSPCTPFISDIVRFSSLMDSIEAGNGWELYIKQLWVQSHLGTPHADGTMHHDLLVESVRLAPTAVTRNTQSVWISFILPQWVGRVSDVTIGMRNHLQLVANGVAPSPRSRHAGRSPPTSTWEMVVMDDVSFRMPQNETELLLQSHTDGLYAWEEAGVLHLVAYIHAEHLLPVAFKQLAGIWPGAVDTNNVFGRWGAVGCKPAPAGTSSEATYSSREPKTVIRSGWNMYMPTSLTTPVVIPLHDQSTARSTNKLATEPSRHLSKASINPGNDDSCADAQLQAPSQSSQVQPCPCFAVMLHLDFSQLGKSNSHSFAILLVSKQPGDFIGADGIQLESCSLDGGWAHVQACEGTQPSLQQQQHTRTAEVEARLQAALQACASAGLHCPHTTLLSQQLTCSAAAPSDSSSAHTAAQDKAQPDMVKLASCIHQLRAGLNREGMLDFSLYPVGFVHPKAAADSHLHVAGTCHSMTSSGDINKQHVPENAEGRLIIGRCGVEVWQGDLQPLPDTCLPVWNSFAESRSIAAQQQHSLHAAVDAAHVGAPAAGHDGNAEQLFEMYMANFMVDGVQQPLWANKLEFWLPHVQGDNSAGSLHPSAPWGLIRLKITREAALMLWGDSHARDQPG